MSYHNVDVDIRVNGKPLRLYSHHNRTFVEAKNGSEYTVKINNNNYKRILAVVTVDGVNVLDEQAGGSSKAGYVINGWSSYEVKGWRTSSHNVNAFKFSAKSRSYAAKSESTHGDTSNCGVIGVEIYLEKEKPVTYQYNYNPPPINIFPLNPGNWPSPKDVTITWSSSNTGSTANDSNVASSDTFSCLMNSMGSSSSDIQYKSQVRSFNEERKASIKPDFDMGTEFSQQKIEDHVTDVEFEIGSLLQTFTFYYASIHALENMGVPILKETKVSFPNAFPRKFCKPPTR